jgi:hypothetical protein
VTIDLKDDRGKAADKEAIRQQQSASNLKRALSS